MLDKKFSAVDNSLNVPPEYYDRKIKIQNIRLFEISSLGIMWFNSTIHAKPYPFLFIITPLGGKVINQIMHGCLKLVFWDVRLIPITSETPVFIY